MGMFSFFRKKKNLIHDLSAQIEETEKVKKWLAESSLKLSQCTIKANHLLKKLNHLETISAEPITSYMQLKRLYEIKKAELLTLNRQSGNELGELKLVHEINALNEILNLGAVNETNIPNSLIVYPNDM